MPYYVYVLRSLKNGRRYVGYTNNLERRISEHNCGKSKYARLTVPFELIYFEKHESRLKALSKERYFKSGKGRREIDLIIK